MLPQDLDYFALKEAVGGPVAGVVFGAENYNGLSVIRALGGRGVPVYAFGSERNSIGFRSRYVTGRFVHPDPATDSEGVCRMLLELGGCLRGKGVRAVVIATSDRMVQLLSDERDRLGEFFLLHLPPADVIAKCLDKQAQYELAEKIGVAYPRNYSNEDAERLLDDLKNGRIVPPLLLKARSLLPRYELNRKYRRAVLENARAVEEIVASAREDEVPWVVQEIIPGGDDTLYTFGSCMAHDGRLKGVFTGRKLRQKPPGFGICRVGETVLDRELEQDGTRFLQALGYHGISQVEFKYDARDRRYKLMEVNPRCWVWVGLPIRLGINLPFAFFCDALGLEIPCFEMTSGRALWICLSDDLEVSLAYRDGRPWTHLSKGYDQIVEAYADTSDPLPGLVHAGRTLADYVGRALAKLGKLAGG